MFSVNQIKTGILAASISAALFLYGCSGNTTEVESNSKPAVPVEDTSFVAFFQKFSLDPVFQNQHLATTVRVIIPDLDVETDSIGTDKSVKPADWKFKNLTVDFLEDQDYPLKMRFERPDSDQVNLLLTNDELNADIRYKFCRNDGRWELVEFRDETDRTGEKDEMMMEELYGSDSLSLIE